jgi:hypothetical protein
MRQLLKIIICKFKGHHYKPSCEMKFTQANKHAPMRNCRYRYSCERCSKKTNWMNQKKTDLFHIEFCPTWGDKGSDSQGYRESK